MNIKIILLFTIFYYFQIKVSECATTEEQCYDRIYRQCNHETTFTTKEIEATQLFLNRRFSETDPIRPACPIGDVNNPPCIRKDIKCLTQEERDNLTSAWVQLYSNGVIHNLTKLHSDYWCAEHKFTSGARSHFMFINKLENELRKINPSVCLPYWNFPQDFAHPEKSVIWDIFGHAGNESNNYCVPDGPFAGVTCTYPSDHCLRRQWRISPKIDPWKGPEYFTMQQQMLFNLDIYSVLFQIIPSQLSLEMYATSGNALPNLLTIIDSSMTPYFQRIIMQALLAHFDTHLSIGGYNGDMSLPLAPNDPLFHIFHIVGELQDLLWGICRFFDTKYLVPITYNGGIVYDIDDNTRRFPNINTDTFNYYPDVYVKEGFQFGYGDMCHLYDIIIKPINYLIEKNLQFEENNTFARVIPLLYPCVPEEIVNTPIPTSILSSDATLPALVRPLCTSGPLPVAAQRLKDCLSPELFQKYFPAFASNRWSFCENLFLLNDDCNPISVNCKKMASNCKKMQSNCKKTQSNCKKMPSALNFRDTEEGERQYNAFNKTLCDLDETGIVDQLENFYKQFMDDLNNSCYCSPFV